MVTQATTNWGELYRLIGMFLPRLAEPAQIHGFLIHRTAAFDSLGLGNRIPSPPYEREEAQASLAFLFVCGPIAIPCLRLHLDGVS